MLADDALTTSLWLFRLECKITPSAFPADVLTDILTHTPLSLRCLYYWASSRRELGQAPE